MKPLFNQPKRNLLATCIAFLLFASCATRQDVAYFQDEPLENYEEVDFNTDIIYKTNDKLSIIVSSIDPEAARPFNLPTISEGQSAIVTQGSTKMQTYLVDKFGNIEFPVLGQLKVGGLGRTEATELIKERLKEYLKDPIVNIRLINFTVTILGEVRNPGTFVLEDEKISLSEALGYAGDLTIHGRRDNVLLIRDNNGQKKYAKFDLTSISVVNNQSYYLTQDDVIYVSPNKARIRSSTYNQNTAVVISALAVLVSLTAIIVN
ncbi:polysaccharide biosynthesis/export family protein [Lacinutrix sp. C3R15]|uniref:polysaccharide biosynthesis/export family protein n=1 Tax=Flavobacteriaceae TaxID=49546 RepID=UPI001C098EA4|nr:MULTISPECIES: polysaccharide biosynthesis/export family protein [Flavobacteriaceae]MBU2938634.1 polysaccharide biosynthesis/export family protein [Lacinutrix sp. C3R15]MDO6621948.1 polysaccharide biosynthesis/export family protein [Oceanihabitans sp. 1_MG-2023]